MCVAIVLFDGASSSSYPFILAFNRDEKFERETVRCHEWQTGIIGGRDAVHGGTWLAASPHGRIAFLTNLDSALLFGSDSRKTIATNSHMLSRGSLVVDAVQGGLRYLESIDHRSFMPFQLVTCDVRSRECFYTSRGTAAVEAFGHQPRELVVSNFDVLGAAELTTKSSQVRSDMRQLRDDGKFVACDVDEFPFDDVFRVLSSRSSDSSVDSCVVQARNTVCIDPLPVPGSSEELWGTRSQSVVVVHRSGRAMFAERTREATDLVWDPPTKHSFHVSVNV